MTIFVAAHLPLFTLLVALVASRHLKIRRLFRLAVAFFLVAHGVLHARFQNNPAYEFSGFLSSSLIFGGAVLGTIYLVVEWTRRPVNGLEVKMLPIQILVHPLRLDAILLAVISIFSFTYAEAAEFHCPLGREVSTNLGQGVSMRTCIWEKEPSVFVRTGPLELIKNGILILKTQTDQAGKLHGTFTSWNDQGEIIENGNYVKGLKEGPWFKIDANGKREDLLFNGGSLVEQ